MVGEVVPAVPAVVPKLSVEEATGLGLDALGSKPASAVVVVGLFQLGEVVPVKFDGAVGVITVGDVTAAGTVP